MGSLCNIGNSYCDCFRRYFFLTKNVKITDCFILRKNSANKDLANKEHTPEKIQMYKWFSRFQQGKMAFADQPLSQRPSTT